MKLAFLPPPLIVLLIELLYVIPLFYKLFQSKQISFETPFWWLAVVRLIANEG